MDELIKDFIIKNFVDGKGEFYQRIKISDNIEKEEDTGFLYCKGAILGHVGTQLYSGVEVGITTKKVVEVKREAQDVFDEASLASFTGKPITLYHPDVTVNSKNIKDYAVGYIIKVWHDEVNIYGDLVIQTEDAVSKVLSGELRDLSLGYNAKLVPTQDGALKQEEIVINHLAIVKEGRAVNATIRDEQSIKVEDGVHINTSTIQRTTVDEYDDETGKSKTTTVSIETHEHEYSAYEKLMKDYKDSLEKKEVENEMEKDFKYFANELEVLKKMPKSDFRDKAFEVLDAECKEVLKVGLPAIVDAVVVKDSAIEKSVGLRDTKDQEDTQEKKIPVVDAQAEEMYFAKLYRSMDKKENAHKYASMSVYDVYDMMVEGRKK